jgi:hypothetical protein
VALALAFERPSNEACTLLSFEVSPSVEQATAEFYQQVLGVRLSDWISDYFVFLRCGPDHHTVNFIRGSNTRMHHIAFEMRDASHWPFDNSDDLISQEERATIIEDYERVAGYDEMSSRLGARA